MKVKFYNEFFLDKKIKIKIKNINLECPKILIFTYLFII